MVSMGKGGGPTHYNRKRSSISPLNRTEKPHRKRYRDRVPNTQYRILNTQYPHIHHVMMAF